MRKKIHLLAPLVWSPLLASSIILLATGCDLPGRACTLIGCEDMASVRIRGLEAGQTYAVTVEAGAQTIQCTITPGNQPHMTCGNTLYYSNTLDEAHISLLGTPDRVTITVRQDGAVIAQDQVTPEYIEVAPNGPGCPPICLQADIPFDL